MNADVTDEELIEVVMALQLPKPARKKKETKFEMVPGVYGKDDMIG